MRNFLNHNLGFIAKRGYIEEKSASCFVTSGILDRREWTRPGMQGAESIFPLYIYPEESKQETIIKDTERKPNLNLEIVSQIAQKLSLTFTNEKEEKEGTFAPVDILDYIYAVLHSPIYREKYKEFLKIDFPRIPYPKDQKIFWQMVELGAELRGIHLLEKVNTAKYSVGYNIPGDNDITRKLDKNDFEITDPENELGKVWINDKQYFDNVPKVAWEFYIGGYQPAQKWLKDRRTSNLILRNE